MNTELIFRFGKGLLWLLIFTVATACRPRAVKTEADLFNRAGDTLIITRDAIIFHLPSDSSRLAHLGRSFSSGETPYWQQFEAKARQLMREPRLSEISMQFTTCRKLRINNRVFELPFGSCCSLVRQDELPVFVRADSLQLFSLERLKDFFFRDVP